MNPTPPPSPLRVLLVEDSEHDQLAFRRALDRSNQDFDLTFCRRGEDMPRAMQAGSASFDVVVMDHNLPGMNGLDTFRALKEKTDLPPVIMLTGAGSEILAVQALQAGMDDYIIKDPNQGYLQLLPLKLHDAKNRYDIRQAHRQAQIQLKQAYDKLEQMVARRTKDLAHTVESLQAEIYQRKAVEKALRESQKVLRELSLKIQDTQENERRQIAKELHDSIGASLAAIKYAVEGRLMHMRDAPPENTVSLEKVVANLSETIKEVRRISARLRPSILDDLGLLAAIDWHCRNSGEMYTDIAIATHIEAEEAGIPEAAKIIIYRVLQEAVNNALRHSGAENVAVHLAANSAEVRLCVQDDGCGFRLQDRVSEGGGLSGYGLVGMHDRAAMAGGRLRVDSAPGEGTTICLVLPCDRQDLPGGVLYEI
jgi:signal transduction histidine kinase